jgi:cell division protein FtsZ
VAQGDLYMDRAGDRPEPEQRRDEPAYDDHDDRDHRKSGWSLFGRGKRQPAQPAYAPQRTTEMRSTSQVQPAPEPDMGQAEDDLEIPSFLRRLAN